MLLTCLNDPAHRQYIPRISQVFIWLLRQSNGIRNGPIGLVYSFFLFLFFFFFFAFFHKWAVCWFVFDSLIVYIIFYYFLYIIFISFYSPRVPLFYQCSDSELFGTGRTGACVGVSRTGFRLLGKYHRLTVFKYYQKGVNTVIIRISGFTRAQPPMYPENHQSHQER